MSTSPDPGNQPREHTEMPAEGGQPQQQPEGSGAHPQAPAEGADPDLGQARDDSNEYGPAGSPAAGGPD